MSKTGLWILLCALWIGTATAQEAKLRIAQPQERFLIGEMPIALEVTPPAGASVKALEIRVDGKLVATLKKAPYNTKHDFGEQLEPHKLEVTARFSDGSTETVGFQSQSADLNFSSQVRLVSLGVSVRDREGQYVMDLARERFRVLENGRPQTLTYFERESLPLKLALTLDCSGSMESRLNAMKSAASQFIELKRPADEFMIVRFNQVPALARAFTAKESALKSAVSFLKAGGGTRIYDAVYASLMSLKTVRGQRAIVLLTDGVDESSSTEGSGANVTLEEAVESSRKLQVPIYTIGVGNFVDQVALEALARRTGGRSYFPREADEIEGAYAQIRTDLDHRYTLAYESTNEPVPGQWMQVEVRLDDPFLTVQHPEGYVAGEEDAELP